MSKAEDFIAQLEELIIDPFLLDSGLKVSELSPAGVLKVYLANIPLEKVPEYIAWLRANFE